MTILRTAFLSFWILVLAGCSMSNDAKIAEDEVPRFHAALNAGDFQAIYATAGDELRQATKENDFTAFLAAVTRKLGKMQGTAKQTWNVNYHTSGTFVTLEYKSTYEHGEAGEQFVYRLDDGRARLVGWHINSNALITQ